METAALQNARLLLGIFVKPVVPTFLSWNDGYTKYIFYADDIISQGGEFAHRFSTRIARFLPKNEKMSDLLKKMNDSLICSFLVSDLSDLLTSLIFGERPERFAHITYLI